MLLCFGSNHRACTLFLDLEDGAETKGYEWSGNTHFANQLVSIVPLLRLGLR